jgi:FixJ family two-component response regulator
MKGSLNKVIALELNISERTVEHHRAKIMQKMNAGSVAELVQMIIQLQSEHGS